MTPAPGEVTGAGGSAANHGPGRAGPDPPLLTQPGGAERGKRSTAYRGRLCSMRPIRGGW